jgi:hypothetical protein
VLPVNQISADGERRKAATQQALPFGRRAVFSRGDPVRSANNLTGSGDTRRARMLTIRPGLAHESLQQTQGGRFEAAALT